MFKPKLRSVCRVIILCFFSVLIVGAVSAAPMENIPHAKPGEKAIYMVLMPNTDMAHAIEMPTLQRCLDAIQYLTRARCIETVKPDSGSWPEDILRLIPPPDDVPD